MFDNWNILEEKIKSCKNCSLCETRTNVVIGRGNKKAPILFVGEAPGASEDATGVPFVGRAGQLLDNLLECASLSKNDYYIANIIKCRPPNNRDPLPAERDACINFLRNQFALIRPKVIICLGRIAATKLIDENFKITQDHGKWYQKGNTPMMGIFHPAALLRDPNKKGPTLEDFLKIKNKLEEIL